MDNIDISNKQKRMNVDFLAEHRLLRALYNTPTLLEDSRVSEELLSTESTRSIFKALSSLKERGVPFTRDSLLQEYSTIDLSASPAIVDIVADSSTVETCLTDILDHLADYKRRREAVASLKDAINIIEDTPRVTEEQWTKIDDKVASISNLNPHLADSSRDIQKAMTTSEWFEQYMSEFKKRQGGKVYWFRNYLLDSLVEDGPQPGEIGIIASASGSGKSTVCLNLVNNFIETNIPCAYYSLEMSAVTTMDRLLAKRLHIPYKTLKNPPTDDFEDLLSTIEEERATLEANPLYRFCESGDVSLAKIERDVVRFQKETSCTYWVVLIDLLSMVLDFVRFMNGANFAQGIEVAINKLSALAKKLGIHIIGVLQLNRAAEAGVTVNSIDDLEKLRPNRAQIKNANAFLERARYVITTFRKLPYAKLYLEPEEYEEVLDDIIEVSIVKLNNGEIGETVKGIFDGEHFDILPIETEHVSQDPLE